MAKYSLDKKTLRQDIIREKMIALVELADRNRKSIISGAILLVVLAGGIFAYGWYQGQIAKEQALEFYKAEQIIANSTLPDKERSTAAIEALNDFLAAYPDAKLSPYAWMYLAQIYWAEEKLEEARQAFKKVQAHDGATLFTRQLAKIGEAKLDEAGGNFKQSAGRYANLPDKPFSDLKAYNLGRLAAANQRPKEAREHFKKVMNHFPPSRLAQWANEAMSFLP